MAFSVRLQSFPNSEVRLTLFKTREPLTEEKSSTGALAKHLTLDKNSKRSLQTPPRRDSDKPRPGHGTLGRGYSFSTYARRKLIRAGAVLDGFDTSLTLFLTGTLPGSTDESFRAIASYSSYIVNCTKAWIAKRVSSKLDMYVWELQKRGALHLHYVVHCSSVAARDYILSQWKAEWIRILQSVATKSGVDLWRKTARFTHASNKQVTKTDAQIVTKSVARYLSKYLSKSSNSSKSFRKVYRPVRWYGVSRPLLRLLEEATETYTFDYHGRNQAEKLYEELSHSIEASSIRTHNYTCKLAIAKVLVAYYSTDEWGNPANHQLTRKLTMKNVTTMDDCENVRQQLVLSGLLVLTSVPGLERQFLGAVGERFGIDGNDTRRTTMDTYQQIDFIRSLYYLYRLLGATRGWHHPHFKRWADNYLALQHHLSDGDGEIAR